MKTKSFLIPLLLGAVLPVFAAPIVYESFNYSTGNFNSGTTGPTATGTGLTGDWTWNQNGDVNTRQLEILSGSVGVRNLDTANNKLNWGAAPGSGSASNYVYSSLTAPATSALAVTDGNSKTIWMSYALTSGGAGTATVELRNGSASATGGIVFGLQASLSSGSFDANTVQLLGNNGARDTQDFTFTTGQDYLLVGKLTYSMSGGTTSFDSGSLWVLNDSGILPSDEIGLGAAIASFSTASTSTADRTPGFLRISNGSSTASNTFDEIRIGDSFSAVVIPEPGTLALVGIALGALAIFRRRK
jgi:hypothetical protein